MRNEKKWGTIVPLVPHGVESPRLCHANVPFGTVAGHCRPTPPKLKKSDFFDARVLDTLRDFKRSFPNKPPTIYEFRKCPGDLYLSKIRGVTFDDKMIKSTKDMLKSKFDMKDLGLTDVILGIKITRTQNGMVLNQTHYVDKILEKFNEGDTSIARTPIDTSQHLSKNRGESVEQVEYSRIIGSLMYLMSCTRPDLAYAVSRLSRYTSNPSLEHWKSITRLLRYLRYTREYGLHYGKYPMVIEGYSDANWISDIKDSRSTSGYVFTLGGAAISLVLRPVGRSTDWSFDRCDLRPDIGSTDAVVRPDIGSTDAVVRPDVGSIDAVVRPDVGSTDAVVRPGLGSIGFGSNRQKQAIIRKKSEALCSYVPCFGHLVHVLARDRHRVAMISKVILAVGLVGTEGATLGRTMVNTRSHPEGQEADIPTADHPLATVVGETVRVSNVLGGGPEHIPRRNLEADEPIIEEVTAETRMMDRMMLAMNRAMAQQQEVFLKLLEDRDANYRRPEMVGENVIVAGSGGTGPIIFPVIVWPGSERWSKLFAQANVGRNRG
ncbi:hypothetical protein L6452_10634 [Arctium lappa]|uniref:Uncharacterized protein n=1 Tax=Arctium lappa TaxID=4217 RepID=A0ACB9DMN1_ARCLA|nr:hypothetical protein L6452_10634 [Arctium lappa]